MYLSHDSAHNRSIATAIAVNAAHRFPENYYTGEDFIPHEWVIQAILDALREGYLDALGVEDTDHC